jgi:predicted enzyme involved in methoxymalonyl-ACP biosynthesis
LEVIEAEDRFTQYGLIGAAWVNGNGVDHLVMSCRALGLGIEEAFLGVLGQRLAAAGHTTITGRLQLTEANVACRQVFRRNGFTQSDRDPACWSRLLAPPLPIPSHLAWQLAVGSTRA